MNTLYLGRKGLFKKEKALAKAREILSAENLATDSRFLSVSPEEGKIPVAAAGKIAEFLSYSLIDGGRKVVAVFDCQLATVEFQQAILKLLEDGADKADFLLTATEPLLDTIHSRCTVVPIKEWGDGRMREWIRNEGLDVNETALALAGGCPEVYREVLSDTALMEMAACLKRDLSDAPEKAVIRLGVLAEGFDAAGRHGLLVRFISKALFDLVLSGQRLSVDQTLEAVDLCSDELANLRKRSHGKTEIFRFYRRLHSILADQ